MLTQKILRVAASVVLLVGVGLVAPTSAVAVPANVVTSSEFFDVTQGNSIEHVRKVFGSSGRVTHRDDAPGTADDHLWVLFPTYYDDGYVEVEFDRRPSGRWYLVAKHAFWDNRPVRTADKATQSEFHRVRVGNTIGYVRDLFGSGGTISRYLDLPGHAGDQVDVQWPTPAAAGRVQVDFVKNSAGVWKVTARRGFWDALPVPGPPQVTDADFFEVQAGNTLDFARRTFGSGGVINAYDDLAGTAYDSLHIRWPVASPHGWVALGLVRDRAGTWRVEDRDATWFRSAARTVDLATAAELAALRAKIDRGQGVTLVAAREAFGSSGTITDHYIEKGGPGLLRVAWYTGRVGDASVVFRKSASGVWTATHPEDLSGPWQ